MKNEVFDRDFFDPRTFAEKGASSDGPHGHGLSLWNNRSGVSHLLPLNERERIDQHSDDLITTLTALVRISVCGSKYPDGRPFVKKDISKESLRRFIVLALQKRIKAKLKGIVRPEAFSSESYKKWKETQRKSAEKYKRKDLHVLAIRKRIEGVRRLREDGIPNLKFQQGSLSVPAVMEVHNMNTAVRKVLMDARTSLGKIV